MTEIDTVIKEAAAAGIDVPYLDPAVLPDKFLADKAASSLLGVLAREEDDVMEGGNVQRDTQVVAKVLHLLISGELESTTRSLPLSEVEKDELTELVFRMGREPQTEQTEVLGDSTEVQHVLPVLNRDYIATAMPSSGANHG